MHWRTQHTCTEAYTYIYVRTICLLYPCTLQDQNYSRCVRGLRSIRVMLTNTQSLPTTTWSSGLSSVFFWGVLCAVHWVQWSHTALFCCLWCVHLAMCSVNLKNVWVTRYVSPTCHCHLTWYCLMMIAVCYQNIRKAVQNWLVRAKRLMCSVKYNNYNLTYICLYACFVPT